MRSLLHAFFAFFSYSVNHTNTHTHTHSAQARSFCACKRQNPRHESVIVKCCCCASVMLTGIGSDASSGSHLPIRLSYVFICSARAFPVSVFCARLSRHLQPCKIFSPTVRLCIYCICNHQTLCVFASFDIAVVLFVSFSVQSLCIQAILSGCWVHFFHFFRFLFQYAHVQ